MRRRRAAAALYVMVMLVIMTTVTLAYASLSNVAATSEERREQAVIAKLAFDGATLKCAVDAGTGANPIAYSGIVGVGHYKPVVTVSDNSGNMQHTLAMSSTLSIKGNSYTDSRTTALKMPVSQFFYSLGLNSASTIGSNVTLGASGANGDVYCAGNLQLSGNDAINGDVEATGSLSQNDATVTGLGSSSVVPIPLPAPNPSDYSAVASSSLLNILLGLLISGETFTSPYMVIYCSGATTINGTFSGKGVLFVNGDVTVNAPMSYLLPTDEVAIIVTGNVKVTKSNINLVGYWYCGGTFSTGSGNVLTRGCIVTQSLSTSGSFTANYDPIIWNTPGEAANLKLPGFWP